MGMLGSVQDKVSNSENFLKKLATSFLAFDEKTVDENLVFVSKIFAIHGRIKSSILTLFSLGGTDVFFIQTGFWEFIMTGEGGPVL